MHFQGHWTYIKDNRKSQIDFLLSNNKGRQNVIAFNVITIGWHFSDHLPIGAVINFPCYINVLSLLARAKSLNKETAAINNKSKIKMFKNDFDVEEGKKI